MPINSSIYPFILLFFSPKETRTGAPSSSFHVCWILIEFGSVPHDRSGPRPEPVKSTHLCKSLYRKVRRRLNIYTVKYADWLRSADSNGIPRETFPRFVSDSAGSTVPKNVSNERAPYFAPGCLRAHAYDSCSISGPANLSCLQKGPPDIVRGAARTVRSSVIKNQSTFRPSNQL